MGEFVAAPRAGFSKEWLAEGKVVLVLGASGMVGNRFVKMFGGANFLTPSSTKLDITNKDVVREYIAEHNPDFIVNFAAYTDVENAEGEDRDLCTAVNVTGVENILNAIDPEKTHFIQISTDMVFSGSSGPYKENHFPEGNLSKLTHYGRTKALAEKLVRDKLGYMTTILRIMYPVDQDYTRKPHYLRAFEDYYREHDQLQFPLFTDQRISITHTQDVAEMLSLIIKKKKYGTYHCASIDRTTPSEVVPKYLELLQLTEGELNIETREMGELARRYPKNGGLDCLSSCVELDYWTKSVEEIVAYIVTKRTN